MMAWHRCGRRGVIEAVTGSGKTDVALTAIDDAVNRGLFALVIVPSRVLMEQWHERLGRWMPDAEIGRLGDGYRDRPIDCDVLSPAIATIVLCGLAMVAPMAAGSA